MALATDSREKGVGPPVLSQMEHNDKITTVGELLTDEDFVKLKFLCFEWIEKKDWLSITDFDQLVTRLKAKKGEDFLAVLAELLFIVQRYDLLKVLGSCKHNVENEERKLVSKYWKHWFYIVEQVEVDNAASIHKVLLPELQKETRPGNLIDLLCPLKDLLGSQGSILETWKSSKLFEVPGAVDSYGIRRSGTYGLCIIINNKIFVDQKLNRDGTDVDKDALKSLFESFDFKVETKDDLTAAEMKEWIMEVAERSDRAYDCFACCILTHGSEGSVQGVQGVNVKIQDDLIQPFCKAAKALIGKPKLFFIHACQGTLTQRKEFLESEEKKEPEESLQTDQAVPSEDRPEICDYLLYMPTISRHVAYRHKKLGTWFVKALHEELEDWGHKEDILSVLTKVNANVARAVAKVNSEELLDGKPLKVKRGQTAEFHCTLVKKLYLRKKRQPQEAEEM